MLELCYRRLAHGKWINPGFLTGPCLPLYSSGLIILYSFCELRLPFTASPAQRKAVLIILLAVTLTLLEYITGIIFTSFFHVKLWDYSARPANIQGIICPLFSLIWAAAGAVYVLFVHPLVERLMLWLTNKALFSFFAGIYIGFLIIDIVYSFRLVTKIKAFADEQQLLIKYEGFKLSIAKRAEHIRELRAFILPFHSPAGLHAELESYIKELKTRGIKSRRK